MKNKQVKISHAAHIKRHTKGTSNEISFSVLDAAKNAQDEDGHSRSAGERRHFPRLGGISLFTMGRAKKPAPTPSKESGLTLTSGEFVSSDGTHESRSTPSVLPGIATDSTGETTVGLASAAPGYASTGGTAPKLSSKDSPGGMPVPAWKAPAAEVKQRKAARKLRRFALVSAISIACIAGLAVGGMALYAGYQAKQDTHGQLVAAVKQVQGTQEKLEQFDALVMSAWKTPVSEIDSDGMSASLRECASTRDDAKLTLASEKKAIEFLQPFLGSAQELEDSNQALVAINALTNTLLSGEEVVKQSVSAAQASDTAAEGWEILLEADSLARDAAALVTSTSIENVTLSMEKSKEALEKFNQARSAVSSAATMTTADLSDLLEYIDLRIESQNHALASDQAYLERNKELAQQENDAYNQLDNQAVELVKQGDLDPLKKIQAAYEDAVAEALESYDADRSRAESALKALDALLS